jgi:hypothetical protein
MMAKEVYEASPAGAGTVAEGPYITAGVDLIENPEPPRRAPVRSIVPNLGPDPNLGDPRLITPADLAAIRSPQPPAQPVTAVTPAQEQQAAKGFLLYVPLGPNHTGVVKILGPSEEIEADHIDLLCENLLLQKRLLEKREAKNRG